jgi:hypothetical protein
VARTPACAPLAGIVRTPFAEIVPAVVVQLTAEEKLPVPVTAAVQVTVAPAAAESALQVTLTPVTEATWVTATVATPETVGSCVLVARTVTELPVVGAVKTPAGVMLPAEVVQVTPEA